MPVNNRAKATIECEYVYDSVTEAYTGTTVYNKVYIRTEEVEQMDISATIAAKKGRKSGSLAVDYSSIQRKENEEQREEYRHSVKMQKYNPDCYQVYRIVKTTFTDIPSYDGRQSGSKIEKVHLRTEPKEPPSTEELKIEEKNWMKDNYDTDGHTNEVTIDLEPPPFVKWVSIKRGDALPDDEFAVYAGTTSTDGPVYVGRMEGVPGKINIDRNKHTMWNCWVQGYSKSFQYAEILVTNMEKVWTRFEKNDLKHSGLVGDDLGDPMRTSNDGMIVVARTREGEPGKLNFFDAKKYCHLWTHSAGKSTSGDVLILKE